MKKVLLSLSLVAFSAISFAQSGSLSPYAYYGLGALCSQANSASRGMAGVSRAFREGNQINYLNPASYSGVDSLTFIFDMGMSMDKTFYKEGDTRLTKNTADFEYIIAGFRAHKHLGIGFGLVPLSTIGYSFSSTKPLVTYQQIPYSTAQQSTSETTSHVGTGGIRQVFLGVGWEPIKDFSIGANIMYTWGAITHWSYIYYSDSNVRTLEKFWGQDVSKVRFNVGAQYTLNLTKKNSMTLGVTYSPYTHLGDDAEEWFINYNTATQDTTKYIASGGYELPAELAIGLAFRSGSQWRIGFDYDYQKWSTVGQTRFLQKNTNIDAGSIGRYNDRHTFSVGGEWCKNPNGRSYFDRIKFRAGFSYTTPYLRMSVLGSDDKPNLVDGPREISATLGAALPIVNTYNNRSILNIGFQWVNESGSILRENTLRLNIGLTFNERWFAKWKFE